MGGGGGGQELPRVETHSHLAQNSPIAILMTL